MTLMYLNKSVAIRNMAGSNRNVELMLGELTDKELRVLAKHPDLLARVKEIAATPKAELYKILEEEYSLERKAFTMGSYSDEDFWLSVETTENKVPADLTAPFYGWWVSDGLEAVRLAHSLLMREVRINLNIRWIQYKKEHPGVSVSSIIPFGQYL